MYRDDSIPINKKTQSLVICTRVTLHTHISLLCMCTRADEQEQQRPPPRALGVFARWASGGMLHRGALRPTVRSRRDQARRWGEERRGERRGGKLRVENGTVQS